MTVAWGESVTGCNRFMMRTPPTVTIGRCTFNQGGQTVKALEPGTVCIFCLALIGSALVKAGDLLVRMGSDGASTHGTGCSRLLERGLMWQ